jgi:asparagine synthase (glutamine-hydrolysing)
MCGVAGIIDRSGRLGGGALHACASAMGDTLAHRGPDGGAVWCDEAAGAALAHRRLAVIDLSPASAQPMVSASGRTVISYNGEVYNFRELRRELESCGVCLRSDGDTEVLLEGCELWGVRGMADRLVGIFAFALWDREARSLTLVRDRFGVKPLFYAALGERFIFGSELKALRAVPGWETDLDREAVAAYLRLGYFPAPQTIYQAVRKLPPGHLLTVDHGGRVAVEQYWDHDVASAGPEVADIDEESATETLDRMLQEAVAGQLVSDVPVGVFLSGGIDSSTVAALMQRHSTMPISTFSIGFREADHDEAGHAKRVAEHLGTAHHELYVGDREALDVVPRLPTIYDEPLADPSQIPTFLLAGMARSAVTVALSGDGGDEIFGGYNRQIWGARLDIRMRRIPPAVRRGGADALLALPPAFWDGFAQFLPAASRPPQFADKVRKLATLMRQPSADDLYGAIVGQWSPDEMTDGIGAGALPFARQAPHGNIARRIAFYDTAYYLPDDVLAKVDRASMAVGLECRVPLLDHRVAAFMRRLPESYRVRGGRGKYLLRRVLDRYVPSAIVDRPKAGFTVPIGEWLRGPLRDWAADLLGTTDCEELGLLRPRAIRAAWDEHQSRRRNHGTKLWVLLTLLSWRRSW